MRFQRRGLAAKARYLVSALAALCVLGVAGSASAGALDPILNPCGDTLTHPFLPWLDPASYALAPNGGLESGLVGWSSTGGASVVAGNEGYAVHGAGDGFSLSLPSGSSATTPAICVGTLSSTARLFVRNNGSATSTLRVDVLYTTVLGLRGSALVGLLGSPSSWSLTLQLPLLANVLGLPLLNGGTTNIALRFTAQGAGASWQIDDVYVDPYKGT